MLLTTTPHQSRPNSPWDFPNGELLNTPLHIYQLHMNRPKMNHGRFIRPEVVTTEAATTRPTTQSLIKWSSHRSSSRNAQLDAITPARVKIRLSVANLLRWPSQLAGPSSLGEGFILPITPIPEANFPHNSARLEDLGQGPGQKRNNRTRPRHREKLKIPLPPRAIPATLIAITPTQASGGLFRQTLAHKVGIFKFDPTGQLVQVIDLVLQFHPDIV